MASALTPKICLTASAWLLQENKLLLIKHKKLGIWLPPGGHIEDGELPHLAAEREFWEESGIRVQAYDTNFPVSGKQSQYLPNPFCSNLHWVCRENFEVRKGRLDPESVPVGWRKKKCEQHVVFCYMVKPTGSLEFFQNREETLGIGWFDEKEVQALETSEDIKAEAAFIFTHY